MTIHIELNPEMEARMAAEAQARGVPVESYAQDLIAEALAHKTTRSRASQDEFRGFLDSLANKTHDTANLQHDTFSREMIYGEHD